MRKKAFYKPDCKFFRGDIPCQPHKQYGYECLDCPLYTPRRDIILIIKLGAIGDVIRTTPLLHRLVQEYPKSSIWWLTNTPEIVPSIVDQVLPFSLESVLHLQATEFEWVINLDKDPYACALTSSLNSKMKSGFVLKDGKPAPANELAEHKFLTGIFDNINKQNTKSYLEEIFEIVGWKYNGEEYILEVDESYQWNIDSGGKPVIGLNTGCGNRWTSRLWPDHHWIELIHLLNQSNYFSLLLGGPNEDQKNKRFAKETGAAYLGYFELKKFISLVNQCDLVVTAVTMALHIAIGLKKQVVLFNNIFNRHEFELFGRGIILEPEKKCKCFFSPSCKNPEYFCMNYLFPSRVFNEIHSMIKYEPY